jgi:hypothetical protein
VVWGEGYKSSFAMGWLPIGSHAWWGEGKACYVLCLPRRGRQAIGSSDLAGLRTLPRRAKPLAFPVGVGTCYGRSRNYVPNVPIGFAR